MRKLSLKKMKIAAIGNANSLIGGNESVNDCTDIVSAICETRENCWITNLQMTCTCTDTTPGNTTPNNTLIKTRRDCPIAVKNPD